ncbi:MAG: hypothetical protein F6J93_12555 [Oscillatoria sp. SIO1A7]|nr:hypothetical protein [Oscillatoria sp. SIO1A7]
MSPSPLSPPHTPHPTPHTPHPTPHTLSRVPFGIAVRSHYYGFSTYLPIY